MSSEYASAGMDMTDCQTPIVVATAAALASGVRRDPSCCGSDGFCRATVFRHFQHMAELQVLHIVDFVFLQCVPVTAALQKQA